MFSARYLAQITDDLVYLYADLEADIKKEIFKRLEKLEKVTDETVYQMELLQQVGGLKGDVNKLVAKYNSKAKDEIKRLFEEAMETAEKQDLRYYQLGKRELSDEQAQVMNASIDRFDDEKEHPINKTYAKQASLYRETYESLVRMTLTVADETEKNFLREANKAYMRVSSGADSWQDAYRGAVENLADKGVEFVTYSSSGKIRKYTPEAAVKMNILTGINQTASEQTLENAENLGTDLVEVSAHMGARPTHMEWQGKVYSLNGGRNFTDGDGNVKFAPDFYKTCHFGEADGICGINCRHSFYPYFEGMPLEYSKGELSEYKDKRVTLDNKEVTPYEAEQELRLCERNIRHYKSVADGFETTHNTENNPDYITSKNKIYEWQSRARDITNQTGIERKYINEFIGTKSGKQPTGLKFDVSNIAIAGTRPIKSFNDYTDLGYKPDMEFAMANANINRYSKKGYSLNCPKCVASYEALRRGKNVTAKPTFELKKDYIAFNPEKIYKNPKILYTNGTGVADITDFLKEAGPGTRCSVIGYWNNNMGHNFIAENIDGSIFFLDPQNPKNPVMDNSILEKLQYGLTWFFRIDNLDFSEKIIDCCFNRRP